jgi:type I restriction enzyme R subunit
VITEADTCRKYVLPKLYAAGWNDDQISEQKSFTDGRIVVVGAKGRRRASKRADYLLRYARGERKGSGVFSVHESAKPLRTFLKYQY